MANDKTFKIKNGLSATRYLQSSTAVAASDVDMSSGSYFTKTLSANTTFTFSNPPASGTAGSFALEVIGADVSTAYDIANASYDGDPTQLAVNGFSEGFCFNNDGTKVFITGISTDAVQEYVLSTAYDLTTGSLSQSFSVVSQETSPKSVIFNNDGTSMYVLGSDNDTVYQYTLTTGFDVSTASYASKSFSMASEDGSPWSIVWNDDGTKIYMGGRDTATIYEYDLSTAYDISTASYNSNSFLISGQTSTPDGLEFNLEGTKLYINSDSPLGIYQYSLSTPYDITTLSYDNVSYNYNTAVSSPTDISFSSDGTKLYVLSKASNSLRQFSTSASAPATITYPSSVKWAGATAPDAPAAGEKDVYVFVTTDGGTTYYGKQAGDAVA